MSPRARTAGFTLAEVAVTLVIVSIGLVLVLEGLSRAKLTAAETHNRKVARGLAQLTLGEIESGLFWEEVDDSRDVLTGSYADDELSAYHDSWQAEREREERLTRERDEDEEEQVAQPYEKVRIKVTYPKFGDRPNEIVLERWIPWAQVYGSDEDEKAAPPASGGSNSGGSNP